MTATIRYVITGAVSYTTIHQVQLTAQQTDNSLKLSATAFDYKVEQTLKYLNKTAGKGHTHTLNSCR